MLVQYIAYLGNSRYRVLAAYVMYMYIYLYIYTSTTDRAVPLDCGVCIGRT